MTLDDVIRANQHPAWLAEPCWCGYCDENAVSITLTLLYRWMAANYTPEQQREGLEHLEATAAFFRKAFEAEHQPGDAQGN